MDETAFRDATARLTSRQRAVYNSPLPQLLGKFTVMGLMINRKIGSGIFVTPIIVLRGTGSVGGSLLLWFFGGVVAICGLLVWLELGLTIPFTRTSEDDDEEHSVPRSGGEKNYLEYVFQHPKFLVTCMYGIMFIILGNLSGNAVALATYISRAAGHRNPSNGFVVGISIVALTLAAAVHVFSRRGGLIVNNMFAIFKVLLLTVMILLGFIKAGGYNFGGTSTIYTNFDSPGVWSPVTCSGTSVPPDVTTPNITEYGSSNFKLSTSFLTPKPVNLGAYAASAPYVLYAWGGFDQPFHVLSEVKRARRVFPFYTILSLGIVFLLYELLLLSYFLVIPKNVLFCGEDWNANDMATVFFGHLFGNDKAKRAMDALIALNIFGNIIVMTFTASRVKQEIAKEGILPYSFVLMAGRTTPYTWLRSKFASYEKTSMADEAGAISRESDYLKEQTPMAALALHWFSTIFLVSVTAKLQPADQYKFLIGLYSYAMVLLLGAAVSGSLLYACWRPSFRWADRASFRPWLSPLPAAVYFTVCVFLLITNFIRPSDSSPFATSIPWWVVPLVGLSAPLWGLVWYGGLHLVMQKRKKELVVRRAALIVPDPYDLSQYVQRAEVIEHEWQVFSVARRKKSKGQVDR